MHANKAIVISINNSGCRVQLSEVIEKIVDAAMAGEFMVTVQSVSDDVNRALKKLGYHVRYQLFCDGCAIKQCTNIYWGNDEN